MIEDDWLRPGEDIAVRMLDDGYHRTRQDAEILDLIARRWTSRKTIPHNERRCALRLALGRPCSCDLGCRCPQQGCEDPVALGQVAALPIYGESTFEAVLRRHRRSWRFGHFIDCERWFLADCIDEHEDPYTCSWEEAAHYVDLFVQEGGHGPRYIANLREDLNDTWERFALKLAKEAHVQDEEPLQHRCNTVLGAPIPRARWPKVTGIYAVRAHDRLKIGWGKNIAKRLTGQQTFCPYALELVAYVPGASVKDEKALHKQLSSSRLVGEWFAIDRDVVRVVGEMAGAR